MKDLVIIVSAIPSRHELLSRSLVTWDTSIKTSGLDVGIYIWSEGCPVTELVQKLPTINNLNIDGRTDFSGSHIFGYNTWYSRIESKVYLFSHCDILYPKNTVATAFANAENNTYVAFKVFWMSQNMTEHIDSFNWRCPETLEQEQMLFDDDPKTHGEFYYNTNVRNITCWESSTTYAINRYTAEKMYPLPDFGTQGADDPFQAGLRQRLGIRNYTVMDPILMHQYHENSWLGTAENAVRDAQRELQKRFG